LCVVSHVLASDKISTSLGKRKLSALEPADEGTFPSSNKRVISLGQVSEGGTVASSHEVQPFVEAVKKGDMNTAFRVFHKSNDKLREHYGEYLVSLGKSELVKLVNGAGNYKTWMLSVILVYADQELIDEVSAETKPTDDVLSYAASNADVTCKSDKFIYILGIITGKRCQGFAVGSGVAALFIANKSEYLDPMLSALQNKSSLDPSLTKVAIQRAFRQASGYTDDRMLYIKRFFDHPAVLVEDYSDALYSSYSSTGLKRVLFHWLLARADNQDLEKARRNNRFSYMSSEYQEAVTKASLVDITMTRHEMGRLERITIIRSALDGLVADVLIKMIIDYYFEW